MHSDPNLIACLDAALDSLLTVRAFAGPLDQVELPVEALDITLACDDIYQAAKVTTREVLEALLSGIGEEHRHLVLSYEMAMHGQGAAVSDVAFAMGVMIGQAKSGATGSR